MNLRDTVESMERRRRREAGGGPGFMPGGIRSDPTTVELQSFLVDLPMGDKEETDAN